MNIKPLADRVLVKPAAAEEKTVAGIIIPDTAKEKPLKGEVLAVGNGTKDEEMVLKVGDTVLYGKYSGNEVELDGEKYLIMRQSDVLAVLALSPPHNIYIIYRFKISLQPWQKKSNTTLKPASFSVKAQMRLQTQ